MTLYRGVSTFSVITRSRSMTHGFMMTLSDGGSVRRNLSTSFCRWVMSYSEASKRSRFPDMWASQITRNGNLFCATSCPHANPEKGAT
ncbi:hypothetical protein GT037_011151 [Alternaria burnsii]|uniref:Uncharacterized protein n=1 Tax=Alternaria burnsii TaxID=1187904 RepID=A0A8H7EAS6_9PLEO|nr:uncharacterized protein GT037_011151 [Alternaria burnsii]KAF7670700.1 hypothetical protein GT037_011151 [Alternaria burnsii]